jgi:hypothetical protein
LLLGEDVLIFRDGRECYEKSATNKIVRDFGVGIGEREGNASSSSSL